MQYNVVDIATKRYDLLSRIKNDLHSADLKITLLAVACNSSNAINLPSKNVCSSGRKCVLDINKTIPGVQMLVTMLSYPKVYPLDESILELLYWLIIIRCDPKIITEPFDSYKDILENITKEESTDIPDYIFRIRYCPSTRYSLEWEMRKANYQVSYGYFVPELSAGLTHLFSGSTAFVQNQPFLLNTSLKESCKKARYTMSWMRSLLGLSIKLIMVIEYIDHPVLSNVNYVGNKLTGFGSCLSQRFKMDNHFTVRDPTSARCSYIFVYRKPVSVLQPNAIQICHTIFIGILFIVVCIILQARGRLVKFEEKCKYTF